MTALAQDLLDRLTGFDPDPETARRLVRLFHRSLARRVLGTPAGTEMPAELARLSPAMVAAAHAGEPVDAAQLLARNDTPRLLAYAPDPKAGWIKAGLDAVMSSLGWNEPCSARPVSSDAASRRALALASEALSVAWPNLWSELTALVEVVVQCEGPFRSATRMQSFGAIWTETSEVSDPLHAFELLLHEGGHHALGLREQFGGYLVNAGELGSHPLRPDPRPLRGVLHAAFVTCRLTEGLMRYREHFGDAGPLEGAPVSDRWRELSQAAIASLEVLERQAEWTPAGRSLFEALCGAAR